MDQGLPTTATELIQSAMRARDINAIQAHITENNTPTIFVVGEQILIKGVLFVVQKITPDLLVLYPYGQKAKIQRHTKKRHRRG